MVGTMMGGAAAFGVVAVVGSAWDVDRTTAVSVVVIAALWIGSWHGTGLAFPPLPYRNGQVPRHWSRSLPGILLFGSAMGLGLATRVSNGIVHFALVLTLLLGEISTALGAGVAFGLGRSAPVLVVFIARRPKDATRYGATLARYYPARRRLAVGQAVLILGVLATLVLI